MAENAEAVNDGGGGEVEGPPVKCPECEPGLPGWMATFSDLVTLLLTFFVLLLSFAKTETSKYEAALGSIRNAFGGNVMKQGEVIQRGKSPDNKPTMMDAPETIKPFPIEFLTSEGLLDKLEMNRDSGEELELMKSDLKENNLSENVNVYEVNEGIKVRVKDKLYFDLGSLRLNKINRKVFDNLIKLMKAKNWTLFVEGHSSRGETSANGKFDTYFLSSMRATEVTKLLVTKGVRPSRITTVFYGDTRLADSGESLDARDRNQRVEFMLRKTDLRTPGHKVDSQ